MFRAVARIFRTPDLRRKIGFTLGIVALFRLGSFIPAPFVDFGNVQACLAGNQGTSGLYELVNLFSGGALLQLSIFALGIMPYITASIIVQLLRVVIPHFDTLYKEGQSGQAKLTQYTRYLTIALGVLQSTTLITVARCGALFGSLERRRVQRSSSRTTPGTPIMLMVITMTAGTGLIMWMGELITERGIGNGMSLLIFTSIAARFPTALWSIAQASRASRSSCSSSPIGSDHHGARRVRRAVPAAHPRAVRQTHGRAANLRRQQHLHPDQGQHGRRRARHLRLVAAVPARPDRAVQPAVRRHGSARVGQLGQANLTSGDNPLYMVLYFLLIVGFTYFYVAITFNPEEVADNMKKYGGFIPGIRAGRPTAEYLDYVLTRVTLPGSLYLGLIALIPLIALATVGANQNFPFGGASILIIVGVGLETVKQIDSQLQQRHYEGLLR